MAEEFTMMIKEILDRAGMNVSFEQIEACTGNMVKETPATNPRPDVILKKIRAEDKDKALLPEEGQSWKGKRLYLAVSGIVELEYTGRAHKKYQGGAIILIKPDDSLVVHGMKGVNPVSYIARADDIRCSGQDQKFIVNAAAGNDRLTVIFHRIFAMESLFEKAPPEDTKPSAEMQNSQDMILSDEDKALEARLRKLRIDLAGRDGISFLPAVYDNKTMRQLVRQRPKTLEDLKQVKGFGAKRIERYAESVLKTINGDTGDRASA